MIVCVDINLSCDARKHGRPRPIREASVSADSVRRVTRFLGVPRFVDE